ncbi:MAG: hypothetical protein K8T90_16500 [Planctomycetes bacterium]|nr:hypothetical protein [Planctomycetota bacterium]
MADESLVKVLLHDRGDDLETVWAVDLGPAAGADGARRVRLDNVPFLHAKPTYGDEIVAAPGNGAALAWDKDGRSYRQVCESLAKDGGRWVMIVDYALRPGAAAQTCWDALVAAAEAAGVAPEGAWGPTDDGPGRGYFAVPRGATVAAVMAALRGANPRCELELIHPVDDA